MGAADLSLGVDPGTMYARLSQVYLVNFAQLGVSPVTVLHSVDALIETSSVATFLKASPTVLLWHWKYLFSWGRLYPPIPSPERPLQILSGAEPDDTLPENVVESWEVTADLPRGILSMSFLPAVLSVNHVWCDGTIGEEVSSLLGSGDAREVFSCNAKSWVLKFDTLWNEW